MDSAPKKTPPPDRQFGAWWKLTLAMFVASATLIPNESGQVVDRFLVALFILPLAAFLAFLVTGALDAIRD